MSHNGHFTTAKFIAHGVLKSSRNIWVGKHKHAALIAPDEYMEEEKYKAQENNLPAPTVIPPQNGWQYVPYSGEEDWYPKGLKNPSDILGDKWSKERQEIWLVNESKYSNIADFSVAVVSDNRQSIENFLKDNNLQGQIEENDIVESWY